MTQADFNCLLVSNQGVLVAYATTLTKDYDDAHDLMQETMMRALVKREKFAVGSNIRAWLYTMMKNIFINNYRKQSSHRFINSDLSEPQNEYAVPRAYNTGISSLHAREIKKSMSELPPSHRTAIELYAQGYLYKEIAEMLDEPLGTIKSRIHLARKALAVALAN